MNQRHTLHLPSLNKAGLQLDPPSLDALLPPRIRKVEQQPTYAKTTTARWKQIERQSPEGWQTRVQQHIKLYETELHTNAGKDTLVRALKALCDLKTDEATHRAIILCEELFSELNRYPLGLQWDACKNLVEASQAIQLKSPAEQLDLLYIVCNQVRIFTILQLKQIKAMYYCQSEYCKDIRPEQIRQALSEIIHRLPIEGIHAKDARKVLRSIYAVLEPVAHDHNGRLHECNEAIVDIFAVSSDRLTQEQKKELAGAISSYSVLGNNEHIEQIESRLDAFLAQASFVEQASDPIKGDLRTIH